MLGNVQMAPFGYDELGLQGSSIDANLEVGGYIAAHVYGWTEFDIDATSQILTVTVWGIEPHTKNDVTSAPESVLSRVPAVVTRFRVTPK